MSLTRVVRGRKKVSPAEIQPTKLEWPSPAVPTIFHMHGGALAHHSLTIARTRSAVIAATSRRRGSKSEEPLEVVGELHGGRDL